MSIDHDYAFAANSSKKLGTDGRPVQMQMGDHQMIGNQRGFVQKVIPGGSAAPNGGPNAMYVQSQTVRMVQHDANGQQRMVQMSQGVSRQMVANGGGGGPHMVRQGHPAQQFQQNYGHVGTIAGRSAVSGGQLRMVQGNQHFQQRPNGGGPMVVQQGQGGPQRVYVTSQPQQHHAATGQPVRYVQAHPGQQRRFQQGTQFIHQPGPQMGAQTIVQQRAPQQIQRAPQMNHQPQIHHQQQQQQMAPQMQQQQQPQYYVPRGMNLAVPLREPSPEPVIKVEEPEVPPETSIKNEEPMPDTSEIDIQIRNVVCNYTLPLHIDLRKLAMNTTNVTYEREKGVMMKQKRSPGCYIKVYSSGKVYIVGCRSESDCRKAARSIARHVQRVMGKLHERVIIRNYRINNVLATCRLPFGIKIEDVAAKYPAESTYEPELSVGLVWRSITPKATLRIHTTGSITVTGASSEEDVLEVISKIYDVVVEFRCMERAKGGAAAAAKKRKRKAPTTRGPPIKKERFDDTNYSNSGVINNQVYFSDEDEDLYDDLDLDEEI
uniref:TATA box-binding protein-like 1 n=1 Tax=Caenorhabditis japonica TaxID=281687 RepID=A0A8R1DVU9_CAEJA